MKPNYLAPAIALGIGLVAISTPGKRRRAAAAVGWPMLAGCGYWYLRNLVQAGNPFPWVKSLGPLNLPAPDQALGGRRQESVLGYLFDGSTWRHWFLPGLHHSLGWLWPLVAGLALLALIARLAPRRDPLLRVLGAVGLITAAAWLAGPASAAGPSGMPLSFESGLSARAPALILGLTLLPSAGGAVAAGGPRRSVAGAALRRRSPGDASGASWYSGYRAGALADRRRDRGRDRGARLAAAAPAPGRWACGCGGGGRPAGDRRRLVGAAPLLDHRYADPRFTAAGLTRPSLWARDLHDQRIATTATRQYPLWGTELSNRVQFAGLHRPHAGFVRASTCEQWRRLLNAGDYDYVVASLDRSTPGGCSFLPRGDLTRDPERARGVAQGATVVYRLDGPLPISGCRALGL